MLMVTVFSLVDAAIPDETDRMKKSFAFPVYLPNIDHSATYSKMYTNAT